MSNASVSHYMPCISENNKDTVKIVNVTMNKKKLNPWAHMFFDITRSLFQRLKIWRKISTKRQHSSNHFIEKYLWPLEFVKQIRNYTYVIEFSEFGIFGWTTEAGTNPSASGDWPLAGRWTIAMWPLTDNIWTVSRSVTDISSSLIAV